MSVKLLNSTELAEVLGRSRWWVTCLKAAAADSKHPETGRPDNCFRGIFTTVDMTMGWLERHPEFVANHVYAKREAAA